LTRRRNSFAKIGILALVMLVALGVLGATFSVWSEILYIDGTVSIGTVSGGLTDDTGSQSYDGTSISWEASGNVLEVTVTNAQLDIEYTCQFTVQNTGSIPVKIQSIGISGVSPEEVDVWITGVEKGDQIEDGQSKVGTVYVSLKPEPPENPSEGETFTVTVTISVVQWNLYAP